MDKEMKKQFDAITDSVKEMKKQFDAISVMEHCHLQEYFCEACGLPIRFVNTVSYDSDKHRLFIPDVHSEPKYCQFCNTDKRIVYNIKQILKLKFAKKLKDVKFFIFRFSERTFELHAVFDDIDNLNLRKFYFVSTKCYRIKTLHRHVETAKLYIRTLSKLKNSSIFISAVLQHSFSFENLLHPLFEEFEFLKKPLFDLFLQGMKDQLCDEELALVYWDYLQEVETDIYEVIREYCSRSYLEYNLYKRVHEIGVSIATNRFLFEQFKQYQKKIDVRRLR